MRSKLLIALTLLLAVVKTNYTIEIKCGYYNCGYACNQCQVFNGGPSVNMPYVFIVQKAVLPTTPSIYHSPVKAVITPITIVLTPSSKRDTILTLVALALMTTIGMSTKLVLMIYTPH